MNLTQKTQKIFFTFCSSGLILAFFFSCSLRHPKQKGVVRFYNSIPENCKTVKGLKQKQVIPVYTEKQLRDHYNITFLVRFNDDESPSLYGALYHQDQEKNLYCMALRKGKFAVFSDSTVGRRRNVIQEVCYPIRECR